LPGSRLVTPPLPLGLPHSSHASPPDTSCEPNPSTKSPTAPPVHRPPPAPPHPPSPARLGPFHWSTPLSISDALHEGLKKQKSAGSPRALFSQSFFDCSRQTTYG